MRRRIRNKNTNKRVNNINSSKFVDNDNDVSTNDYANIKAVKMTVLQNNCKLRSC